jgi:serine/threonine-protein kinase
VAEGNGGEQQTVEPSAEPSHPGAFALTLAVVLAVAHALWSLFQWRQLVLARSGGDYFCGLGGEGGCAAVWDSPLAHAIRDATGLPVAGWGLAWSIVAFALPLSALRRRARGLLLEPAWSATLMTALAGIASVVILAAAALGTGQLCTTCVITYGLVLAYAATCLLAAGKLRAAEVRRGAVLALGSVVVAFLILLYPGLRTPRGSAQESAALVESIEPSDGTPLGKLISRLSPPFRQGLSNALAAYAEEDRLSPHPARELVGPSTAAVRITGFSDILCGHCADLHRTVKLLREKLPPGSFAYEPRQFPLDGDCNSAVELSAGDGVRCLAARALICAQEEAMDLADALYESQRRLTTERIYDLAAPFMSRERLEDCVASPETEAKLEDDIEWATEYEIVGTPLVIVNGREASPAVHFLFAMVLAGADPEHPAFAVLPPPGLRAGNR